MMAYEYETEKMRKWELWEKDKEYFENRRKY